VIDLQSVPHFIVYSENLGFEGESWTVQCEVLQGELLGGGPRNEDPAPELPLAGAPFDLFGLGQPGPGPVQNLDQAPQHPQPLPQDWELWPAPQVQAQQAPLAQNLVQDLNLQAPNEMEIDLNQPAQQVLIDDPQEVIVNPAQPVPARDFLELNDFIEEVVEEVQEIAVQLPPPIPEEENLLDLANQVQKQEVAPLQFPLNPVNVWVEEVPLDQLVEFEDDGFPNPDQLVGPGEEGFPIEQMEVEDAHIEEEE
jgi:hypothetical protein